jgi:hypothetical protein
VNAAILCLFLQGPVAPSIALPGGPAARAFASVGAETQPQKLALPAFPRWPEGAQWNDPALWRGWADDLRAEAQAGTADPARRARLCAFALAQGRSDDAWDHFAALAGAPSVCAALLPRLLPGVPIDGAAGKGGIAPALADGIALAPALPPPSRPASEVVLGRRWIERREMRIEGLVIGDATLSMRVALESDGVQIDFDHRSGGTAHVSVWLPEPPDFEIYVAYVDWMRQDAIGGPLALEIPADGETHTLFGRLQPRAMPWPTSLPTEKNAGLELHGLRLEIDPGDPATARIEALSRALSDVLGLPASVLARAPKDAAEPFGGTIVSLHAEPGRDRKVASLVSLAERYALSQRDAKRGSNPRSK